MRPVPIKKFPDPMNLAAGTRILNLVVAQKIGHGAFGEIYSAIDIVTGTIWAVKTESPSAHRKTLAFEYQILAQIQSSPHFPRLGTLGRCSMFSFYSMENLGPSLSQICKGLEPRRFSFSTGVRASYHILKCIESFHRFGFVHRDIKPGNILTRENAEYPLCLIDFGLSRVYVNPETGQHLPQRPRVGFRGTRAYASRNAHLSQDLSRRDDLISWFYLMFEFTIGPLPWRRCSDKGQILYQKENFDIRRRVETIAPELFEIWKHIAKLGFPDAPNYRYIDHYLMRMITRQEIAMDCPFDWTDMLREDRTRMAETLQDIRERSAVADAVDITRESGGGGDGMGDYLLSPHMTVPPPFSHASETEACGCC
jgi:serine/threonine protein kinase